jgi:hypothetical protein
VVVEMIQYLLVLVKIIQDQLNKVSLVERLEVVLVVEVEVVLGVLVLLDLQVELEEMA